MFLESRVLSRLSRHATEAASRVPSMGRIYLDERSQTGPMMATVVKRKA